MKEDILSHIQNNHEASCIYSELKTSFLAHNRVTFPKIWGEDKEEIYNDSFVDLIDSISSRKLQQLTYSLQTYINTIGYNKSIDLLRKKNSAQSLPDYERIESDNDSDIADGANDATAVEHQEEIYRLVKDVEDDTCRIMLFGFYWQHYLMGVLAELAGLSNASVAKGAKVRRSAKLRNAALAAFRKKGLIQYGYTE